MWGETQEGSGSPGTLSPGDREGADVDHTYLLRIERGEQRPPVDLLLRLARVLQLPGLVRELELTWPAPEDSKGPRRRRSSTPEEER
ncbi:MAG: helix-turn-helix domain-containing protein [Actinomycetota bacterium]